VKPVIQSVKANIFSQGSIRLRRFILRLAVVIFLHIIFKHYDFSFKGAFEWSRRSLAVSFFFITYWMIFWELCSIIYNRYVRFSVDKISWYRQLVFVSILLLAFEAISSMIFNWTYLLGDFYFFGNRWKDIHFVNPEVFKSPDLLESIDINPEMFFGLMLYFLLVLGIHIFITSMKNMKELEIAAAQQKKESVTAQYSALKNQIDPHFFFNSLSVLSSLIYESTDLSQEYLSHLSKHYRNILETNAERLVTISKELEFLESYFFLIRIRHQDYIKLQIKLSETTRNECKILPHVLQMLAENAVKHNVFKNDMPLIIDIMEDENFIIVKNNVNKRRLVHESTGIGLQNIISRYALEGKTGVIIESNDRYFIVKLPKIR
jgi:two-component system, LytTR family, sensor kinase